MMTRAVASAKRPARALFGCDFGIRARVLVAREYSCCTPEKAPARRKKADQNTANCSYGAEPRKRKASQVTTYPASPEMTVAPKRRPKGFLAGADIPVAVFGIP